MSRWRDIKQGKVEETTQTNIENSNSTISCAPILARIKAFITDTFLITTPIIYIIMYLVMGSGEIFSQFRIEGWSLILIIHLLIIMTFWIRTGQTPGMKAYDLKLIHNEKDKLPISSLLSRYFILLISIISVFGLFTVYFRKDNKTFQDIFSNTSIIECNS